MSLTFSLSRHTFFRKCDKVCKKNNAEGEAYDPTRGVTMQMSLTADACNIVSTRFGSYRMSGTCACP